MLTAPSPFSRMPRELGSKTLAKASGLAPEPGPYVGLWADCPQAAWKRSQNAWQEVLHRLRREEVAGRNRRGMASTPRNVAGLAKHVARGQRTAWEGLGEANKRPSGLGQDGTQSQPKAEPEAQNEACHMCLECSCAPGFHVRTSVQSSIANIQTTSVV